MDLGGLIRAARKRAGLTQVDLATLVEVDHSHLSRVERGAAELSLGALVRIARALDLSPLQLGQALLSSTEDEQDRAAA